MMGMEPTSLSRTLKLMEDEGFILRKESEKDKRQVLIFLTDRGLEKRRIIRSSLLSFNEELERKISHEDLQGFNKVMNALDNLIEEIEKEQK
jgi:DNA-binding MarR family transcriptional regulator